MIINYNKSVWRYFTRFSLLEDNKELIKNYEIKRECVYVMDLFFSLAYIYKFHTNSCSYVHTITKFYIQFIHGVNLQK